MKFDREHTLPMLAVHATWVAVQTGLVTSKGKPLSIEKLLGKQETAGASGGPMTRSGMMAEAATLAEFNARQMEKKKKEGVK
jgi:hypothetical protein